MPLTLVLRKVGIGYEWGKKQIRINHLLFMGDLKLFGKTKNQIDSLINSVHMFSMDVGMEFEIKKCGCLILKRWKVIATRVVLPDRQIMRQIAEDGYKYLGILEKD